MDPQLPHVDILHRVTFWQPSRNWLFYFYEMTSTGTRLIRAFILQLMTTTNKHSCNIEIIFCFLLSSFLPYSISQMPVNAKQAISVWLVFASTIHLWIIHISLRFSLFPYLSAKQSPWSFCLAYLKWVAWLTACVVVCVVSLPTPIHLCVCM